MELSSFFFSLRFVCESSASEGKNRQTKNQKPEEKKLTHYEDSRGTGRGIQTELKVSPEKRERGGGGSRREER